MDASSIQQHRAAPTHALPTTEPSTLELEIISQDVDERGARVRYHGAPCAVDIELDRLGQDSKLLERFAVVIAAPRVSDIIARYLVRLVNQMITGI